MLSALTPPSITFRLASQEDCTHLILFADMATRCLTSFLWGLQAKPGQSAGEVGRNIIRNDEAHFTHFKNWRVATHQDQIIGGLNCYVIPDMSGITTDIDALKPLNALKAIATGSWYISSAAIYPEYQGKGYGKALIAEAERLARSTGKTQLTLMVNSHNKPAHGLYLALGFQEWEKRPFVTFPGSDKPGAWILMVKDLG